MADDGLAQEATDEGFARAYARWGSVSRMDSPTGWVYVVALNHARSLARKRSRERSHNLRYPDATSVDGPEPADPIWVAVAALAPRARLAVALRYLADLPEAEVARLMGVGRGTVATTLHRARGDLANLLTAHREEEVR